MRLGVHVRSKRNRGRLGGRTVMRSRKENFGGGRRSRCVGEINVGRVLNICWVCTASAVFALLLIGIHHGLMAKFRKGVDVLPFGVSMAVFGLQRCRHCSPDMSKFPDKIRRQGEDELKRRFFADGEKFMYYAPHSGFNNQVMELRNALTFAKILNRTLIIPPVLDHHAVWLGSCPKRRVLRPHRLRALVWTRIFDLITNSRYTFLYVHSLLLYMTCYYLFHLA